jgi:mono/diheme cytochrome c family protein
VNTLTHALSVLLLLGLAACDTRRELREWQPSDHQPPPVVAPEGQASANEEGDPEQRAAAALWDMRCATCHGAKGLGDGAGRPPGAALPDFTQPAYQASRSDAELHTTIKNGRGLMPQFGSQLSDLGIDALVKHVRSLSRKP